MHPLDIVYLRVGCTVVDDYKGNNKRLKENKKKIEISNNTITNRPHIENWTVLE